ncbi:hypothetical protein [Bacillus sp. KH172YL63]|nr:hypothetical protein [Bacillus sp. KH172YL63]BCB04735.1 hypothetical protein KH172YL63_28680 [Bacillus sp. KH172YL63]
MEKDLFTIIGVKEYEIAKLQNRVYELEVQLEETNNKLEDFKGNIEDQN